MQEITKDIIEEAAQGDILAFEQIYWATSGFVYNVILRIVRNSADAQEATQDTFMKIYSHLKSFQFRSNFKTWVYRIAVNTAINIYKRNIRQEKGKADYALSLKENSSGPELMRLAQKDAAEKKLAEFLACLSPEKRCVIVLREIEGLSYREIAEILKINLNTVRSRLKRARQALLESEQKD